MSERDVNPTPDHQEGPPKPQQAFTDAAGEKSARERYQEEIARNPKWRNTTEAGHSLVIGGAHPTDRPAEKAEAELEALVTKLVAAYPALTREKAREMLLAAGA